MIDGQFIDEAAGQLGRPAAIDLAISGEGDTGVALGSGDADIGQAPLLLEALLALVVDRALGREHAFLPARQEHEGKLQPLGAMQGHDLDGVVARLAPVQVHDKRHMLQIGLKIVEGLHRLDQLLEVIQPRLARGAVGALHVGVAALLQHGLGQLPVAHGLGQGPPAVEVAHEGGERRAGPRLKLVRDDQVAHGGHGRHARQPGDLQDLLHAGVADAALGRVDDPLEGQVVVLGHDQAQIGMGVADLGPFVEARPADHHIGDGQHHEPFLERPHLERGPHQHGHVAVFHAGLARMGAAGGLDLVGDQPGLGLAVPDAAHLDLVAAVVLGPQRLAQPVAIGRDQARGRAEDMLRRAIVALQPDDLRAREVAFEAQDVVDLGPAPAIDRLVVVADAADIAGRGRQQPQPQILGDIGVLVLVDEDIAKAPPVFLGDIRMLGQYGQVVQQQVAEVAGVQAAQPRLIGGIEAVALAVGEILGRGQGFGRPAAVLPVVDQPVQRPGRPAFGVEIGRFQQLFADPFLIVGVEDGEAGLEPDQFGVPAQDLGRHRVEGAQPAQPLGRGADQMGNPLAHLARGLVGEGDDQQFPRFRASRRQDVRQSRRQHPGLAGSGPGQNEHGAVDALDRQPLFGVQSGQIVAGPAARRTGAGEVGNLGNRQVGHGWRGSGSVGSGEGDV